MLRMSCFPKKLNYALVFELVLENIGSKLIIGKIIETSEVIVFKFLELSLGYVNYSFISILLKQKLPSVIFVI